MPRAGAGLLRTNWQQRSASPLRDFYVASHAGWSRRDAWRQQADVDVRTLFHEVAPAVPGRSLRLDSE